MGQLRMVVADSIDIDESATTGVVDIERHGEGKLELTIAHTVGTIEEHLLPVVILERGVGSLLLLLARHHLAGVADRGRHLTVEAYEGFLLTHDTPLDPSHATRFENDILLASHRQSVDTINDHVESRQIESQGRIAKERILEFVERAVLARTDNIVLSQALGLTHCGGLAIGETQHMAQKGIVDKLIVIGIDRARRAPEGHGSTLRIEQGGLADRLLARVERHDITRGRDPKRQVLIGERAEVADGKY